MCLTLRSIKQPAVAKKDIIVYKHLHLVASKFYTPYQNAEVEFNEVITSPLVRKGFIVYEGIHSFVSLAECKSDAINENTRIVVKCTIPAGSLYYKGSFMGSMSIASDSIRYDEIIYSRKSPFTHFKKETKDVNN